MTSAGEGIPEGFLYRVDGGVATQVADLFAFEAANNPDQGVVESNPFGVADLGHGNALVADAAGNDLLRVDSHGNIELVAVFPVELVSTANVKRLLGCPGSHAPECDLPHAIPAESVPTSVAVGPDGAYYVGELTGFPAPTHESRIWRIDPSAQGVDCGSSPLCTVVFDNFTSVMDVIFGPDGTLGVAQFDDASWFAVELGPSAMAGGSVHACNVPARTCREVVDHVPMLTGITLRGGHLWGNVWSLVPGQADAVRLR